MNSLELKDDYTTLRIDYDSKGNLEMILLWTPVHVPAPVPKRKKPTLPKKLLPSAPPASPAPPASLPSASLPSASPAPPAPPAPLPSSYTAEEVKEMSLAEIVHHFKRITGKESLYCSHCRKESQIEEKWMYSIQKRCSKHGIYKTMSIPKTCSIQLQNNEYVNHANNEAYRTLKKKNITSEEYAAIVSSRQEKMAALGVACRPYRYV